MKVDTILRRKGKVVFKTRSEMSVQCAVDRLRMQDIAALVVVENEEMVGLISEREIVRALSSHGEELLSKQVRDVMTMDIVTCTPDDDLRHVMALMTQRRVRHLPVVRNGRLEGIISIGDIIKHRLAELELETNVLRDTYFATH